jgi:hypothetical protein
MHRSCVKSGKDIASCGNSSFTISVLLPSHNGYIFWIDIDSHNDIPNVCENNHNFKVD